MSPLEKAIEVCGTQSELARRIGGKVKTGHIYFWLRNEVPEEHCPAIEAATGGQVTCEQLRSDLHWERDSIGRVVSYRVVVVPPAEKVA